MKGFWSGFSPDPRSLTFRLILGSAAMSAIALILTYFLLTELFDLHLRRSVDTNLTEVIDRLAAALAQDESGQFELTDEPGRESYQRELSGDYWQISDDADLLLRSPSLWDARLPDVKSGEVGGYAFTEVEGPRGELLRMATLPLIFGSNSRIINFSVAQDLAPVLEASGQFSRILAVSLLVLGFGLTCSVVFMIRVGLLPLRRISNALADIRAGKGRQLIGDVPTEIMPLTVELNALIDHHESIIQRARAQAGDLAHALKTPLAVLRNELENETSPDRELALTQITTMTEVVQRHLARAQAAGSKGVLGVRSELRPVIEGLVRTLPHLMTERQVAIDVDISDRPLYFAGEQQDLSELLGVLMENACIWAKTRVQVKAEKNGARLRIEISDDGPGIPPDKREAALRRGGRLDEGVQGSGLGLAIAQEMTQLYQGTMKLGEASLGGLLVEINLPAA